MSRTLKEIIELDNKKIKTKNKSIKILFKDLKKHLYFNKKLSLRFTNIPHEGLCVLSPNSKTIIIFINKYSNQQVMVDTLIHELAHALMFDQGKIKENNYHCNEWGIKYSEVYRAYLTITNQLS